MRYTAIAFMIILIVAFGCIQQPPGLNITACPADAKLCPDGSAVGRVGPDCEFAPCPQIVGNDSDEHGCKASAGYSWCEPQQKCMRVWEEACEGSMTGSEVVSIAQEACGSIGNLTNVIYYNPNSRTYWIDLDTVKEGCSPACVVSEDDKTAEVNWRCTGLSPPYTVKTANTSLGEILVGGDDMTLYTFTDDSENETTCYGGCAENWPPLLTTGTIAIPKGLSGTFGAIARNDSGIQVTYNSMPLYYYIQDGSPGDTNGQGVGGKWFVVNPEE